MSVYGVMVTKNEAERYLAPTVAAFAAIVDGLLVYDDRSHDATVQIASALGADVQVRPETAPSFDEDEGKFRMAAWFALEVAFAPSPDDSVLSLDADEFLISKTGGDPADALQAVMALADAESCLHTELPVAELFSMDPKPLVRVDGEWGRIRARRLCRWPRSLSFSEKLNSGSIPLVPGPMLRPGGPMILHAGYLRAEDREAKYKRYKAARLGHRRQHVESIRERGKLGALGVALPPEIIEALEAAVR